MMQNNPNVNDTQTNKKSFDKFSVIFFTLSFLLVFWFFVYFIASIEGVDFPKEHELHHTEGIFKPYQIGVNIGRNTYKGVLIQLAKTTNSKPQEAVYNKTFDCIQTFQMVVNQRNSTILTDKIIKAG